MATGTLAPMRAVALAFALLGVCSGASMGRAENARNLTFSLHGETRAVRAFEALSASAEAREVLVFEPYEARPTTFRALPFNEILDAVYGVAWREEEELLVTCSDGYQPVFPVSRLLEHKAWLAFDRTDSAEFSIRKLERGERRRVALSPYYLVWENFDDLELRRQGDYGWPYQLVGIDLIRTQDRFPAMTPEPGSSAAVLAGFTAFRVHCSRCHAINGEGGGIGPELNDPVNPVETREAAWLHQWIDDPASLIPTARMPAFNRQLADRDRVIDEILAYLGAISAHKVRSKGGTDNASGHKSANTSDKGS